MRYTYRNFISTFLQMNTWWYIHTVTLYQLSCRLTRDDIYIPELYINFPADEHVMIYTYRNFISTFLQMNTWWYIHTATLYQLSCTRTRDDMYIRQLYINFLVQFRFFVLIAVGVLIWHLFSRNLIKQCALWISYELVLTADAFVVKMSDINSTKFFFLLV